MIRISNLRLPLTWDDALLRQKAARLLGIPSGEIQSLSLVRQSVDARKKNDIHYTCTLDLAVPDEAALVRRAGSRQVVLHQPKTYVFPAVTRRSSQRPVVVGMGPAGLFAALSLAQAGIPPIVLERGGPVEQRAEDVSRFWATGALNPQSNVMFGEGGAGTFSDGKLTTGTNDARLSAVTEALIAHGAPEDIRWSHKPHIGTDVLRQTVQRVRQTLLDLGCDVRFYHQLTGLECTGERLSGITVTTPDGPCRLETDALVLAPGHSARDTFHMLFEAGVPMQAKPFAIGVRIEHLQQDISSAQYGPQWAKLPPPDYKLACHLPNGRSAFTFCVCPGGEVVAAASAPGLLVTNGMSLRARAGRNINGGLLVGVSPGDFSTDHPLAGLAFQAQWEALAFQVGGGNFSAPAQTVGSFLGRSAPALSSAVAATYRPGVTPADLRGCLPGFVCDTLAMALPAMGRRLRGFDHPEALLTGVETRSSSPVRIVRGADLQSPIRGLYPCGEGGGWAGGIMSAAADGIRVAEAVAHPV